MTYSKDTYITNAYGTLVGKTIKSVRPLTDEECEWYGWSPSHGNVPFVIIMTDHTALVPAEDPEGNGAGHIFIEKTEVVQ
jgi:hypothetical protein